MGCDKSQEKEDRGHSRLSAGSKKTKHKLSQEHSQSVIKLNLLL